MKDDPGMLLRYFPGLDKRQLEQFDRFNAVFSEWNTRINLISRKDTDHFFERHVLHSLGIAAATPLPVDSRIMDLGTGGGFPGIPLAILHPGCHFTLVDSIRKKITAVQDMIREIGLSNTEAQWMRAEDAAGSFDVVVTRAVAPAEKLVGWVRGKSNRLLALKGGQLDEEIKAVGRQATVSVHPLHGVYHEPFFKSKVVLELRW